MVKNWFLNNIIVFENKLFILYYCYIWFVLLFNVCFLVFGGMDILSMMLSINLEMLKDFILEKIEDVFKNFFF